MSLNVELIGRVDLELSTEIELTVQMQTRIRLSFAAANPAELAWLRNQVRKLSVEIQFAVQQCGLIQLCLAIAEA
jgi:hypothetical protein